MSSRQYLPDTPLGCALRFRKTLWIKILDKRKIYDIVHQIVENLRALYPAAGSGVEPVQSLGGLVSGEKELLPRQAAHQPCPFSRIRIARPKVINRPIRNPERALHSPIDILEGLQLNANSSMHYLRGSMISYNSLRFADSECCWRHGIAFRNPLPTTIRAPHAGQSRADTLSVQGSITK